MESFRKFKERVEHFRSHYLKEISVGFLFGLIQRSAYHIKNNPELTKEHVKLSHSLFKDKDKMEMLPLILKTQNGEDNQGNSDLDFTIPGRSEFEYMLRRAVEFNRPNYCVFFILGLMKGSVNERIISESDYRDLLKLIPEVIIDSYKEELIDVNNYFDEIGFVLSREML
uniref:hypothetical protein n=1 Tax=Fulvivirga sp. TaxID=1931237 RepID=UPI00404AEB8C